MKRAAIYSSARRQRPVDAAPSGYAARAGATPENAGPTAPATGEARPAPDGLRGLRATLRRRWRFLALAAVGVLVLSSGISPALERLRGTTLTQEDIDAAVLNTLETQSLPSRAARAAESVRQSVVRVRGYVDDGAGELMEVATGSGVVIVEQGMILTNLHVVQGAERVTVTFFDGLESEALVAGTRPENDLAVVRAKSVPDDLPAATLGSTHKLRPGDDVVAVGFPFGIGPSVTAGVVSGLNREFHAPDGERALSHLIQFDAAANPGSSGGPLVTMDGEVVGIVTAIYSPAEARTFVGIGFAVTIEAAGNAVGLPPF